MRRDEVTAVVLCGGAGARLGSVDKTMVPLAGRPLVEHVVAALAPQVGGFVISVGRDATTYASLGHPTVIDREPGEGPLGGIVSALELVETA